VVFNGAFVFFTSEGLNELLGVMADPFETEKRNLFILIVTEHIIFWAAGIINDVLPSDVENIQILKDAQMFAIDNDKHDVRDN